jgi:HAD superfamily phosphoserine phosphatase-like hydrolase
MIKLVVFDFDGTLTTPETDGNILLANHLNKWRPFSKIAYAYVGGQLSGKECIEMVAEVYKGVTKNEIKKIRRQMKLRPGVVKTFNELKKRKIKIAIVTGEGNEMMKEMIEFLKPDYFDGVDWVFDGDIMTGEIDWDFEYKKELTHHLQNMFNLKPKEMMAVGDTWADFEMVPKGGIKVAIGRHKFPFEKPDYKIKEIPEVLDIIDKIK